ncbi:hypothetical protein CDIK_1776 [Cucumispora dikerogammari]|nr:hypothetical protein CDIK_1776 [Cucumispora dikerogammari]
MKFTPTNSIGFEALQKEISFELELLQTKYTEIIKTKDYEKARRFLTYRSLMNSSKQKAMKTNLIIFFIKNLRENLREAKNTTSLIEGNKSAHVSINNSPYSEPLEMFTKLGICLNDLILSNKNEEYVLLYFYIDLLIESNLFVYAKGILNTARKEGWMSVKYFKCLKKLECKLKSIL